MPGGTGTGGPSAVHEEVSALLAAWALGSGMPGDDARVRGHLHDCAPCAAEAQRLRETVRLLDEPAPGGTGRGTGRKANAGMARGRLMAAARAARPGQSAPAAHAEPYAGAVACLDALLRELDREPARWGTPVVHDWDVQGTVAHLVAADEVLAERLGLAPVTEAGTGLGPVPGAGPEGGFGDAGTGPGERTGMGPGGRTGTGAGGRTAGAGAPWELRWTARTHEVVAYEHTRPPAETREAWRTQAHGLLALPEAGDEQLAAMATTLMGMRLPVADHYVIRAFETWVHTRDIGRALGRVVPPPPPVHLQRFLGLAVRILDLALGPDARPVLLSVEGEAGGDWVLGSDAEPIAAELVLEATDFLLLLGGRQDPDEIARGQAGDAAAAQRLLETATSLAWL
ncbi:maleylpyruvate isomerase family mycothiol-dependent enzyme [Streptomyces albofaciens JCM 4342]|uniref:maleylpyruvate isomerase family mycothiol-dependent enzyme n=1 Tax=Streptomyces albofaciens TaxID=66866 RepID=UPI001239DA24|nr:maleylpyruvate isomerase family mycothiol-dependent enzyme [Streptomyces albofaciens]KAA6222595.1 maleylpyruvate isomerase family mycothiol-dependent enzyme [Streptomyces albofaciens JCM 4342]